MGYSGTADFDFEIERYREKATGKLFTLDKIEEELSAMGFDNDDIDLCYEYQVITLAVEGRSYFQEGRFYGPPENCYPDEGETEIVGVIGPDGKDWQSVLTSSEVDSITDMIADYAADSCEEPDYDDYDYDDDYHHNQD